VRSEEDLSEVDDGVMYGYFKESVLGQGYTTAEFSLPATHFDLTASPDWNRVITNIAGCNGAAGVLNNDRDLYPFVPNMDISFERALPTREAVYNEAGQKLTETIYSFTRAGNAQYIPAFKREYNNGVLAYAKYNVLTGVASTIQQKQEFSFDVVSGQQQQNTSAYFYQGNAHIYPTKIESQSGDGKLLRMLTRYTKDYDASIAIDSASLALKSMAEKNINAPIEIINQIERNGVARTVSANLTRFATFNPGGLQPSKTAVFRNAAGATDFQFSSIVSGNFVNDPRYYTTGNFTDYNSYGQLLTGDNAKGKTSAALYDDYSRLPLATVTNARHDEILYSNFEEGSLTGLWFEANGQASVTAHSGKYSVVTGPSAVLYKELKRKTGSVAYVFSAWINSTAAGNLNVSVTNTSTSQIVNQTINIAAGDWGYYQVRVPVEAMGQNFRLRVWGSASLLIDDVIFRPEEADLQANSYDVTSQNKLATSGANGAFVQYGYDSANRIKYVFDQDRNIVQKTTYILRTNQDQFAPVLSFEQNQLVNQPVYFSSSNYPVFTGDGLTYTWNFGDGSAPVTTPSPNSVTHTYSQIGNYTVSLTKSSPYYGSITVNKNVVVSQPQVSTTQLASLSGDIILTFSNASNQIVAQFTQSQLSAGTSTIAPGVYTLRIGTSSSPYSSSNPSGYKSVHYTTYGPDYSNPMPYCIPSQPGKTTYDFYIDLTGKARLSVSTDSQACPVSEIE